MGKEVAACAPSTPNPARTSGVLATVQAPEQSGGDAEFGMRGRFCVPR